MGKCRKISLDELAKKLAAEKGRKLTAEEKAGLKVLPPQYACSGSSMDSDDRVAHDAALIQASGGQVGFRINKAGTTISAFKKR